MTQIVFPGTALGKLYVQKGEGDQAAWEELGAAQGGIEAPAAARLRLDLTEASPESLQALADMENIGQIKMLKMDNIELSDAVLAQLTRLQSVNELQVETLMTMSEKELLEEAMPLAFVRVPTPQAATAEQVFAPPMARTLEFPSNRSLGRLFKRPWNIEADESGWVEMGQAQGSISVPENTEVKLEMDYNAVDALATLAKLPENGIQTLGLVGDLVTDATLDNILGLKGLHGLHISHAPVTDEGIMKLKVLNQLQSLKLLDVPVTDKGMKVLAYFTYLKHLNIYGANLTNGTLDIVRNMKNLKSLHVEESGIAPEALIILRIDLKGCKITPG